MAQITHGVRSVLSNASVYSLLQRVLGSHQVRTQFVADYVRPVAGMRVLDIGCGPADILAYLPSVDYHGFDISELYVEQARRRFGARGTFHAGILTAADVAKLAPFDIVLAISVLHHMDDDTAVEALRLGYDALKPGGRLVTIDPCFHTGQNPIARFLVSRDRGQNVRNRDGYAALAKTVFELPVVEVRDSKGWIPYTHCWMECRR